MAYADSLTTAGVRLNESRAMLAVNGMIIIARMTLAVNKSMPMGVPLNRTPSAGILPRVFWSAGSIYLDMIGARVNRPHMPYIILGMAANSSMATPIGPFRKFGAISVTKIAMPMAVGMAKNRASTVVTKVP